MYQIDLSGKNILILGIANHRSIAWAIAEALDTAGARLVITYQNERMGEAVNKLTETLHTPPLLYQCDVSSDSEIENTFNQIEKDAGTLWATIHSIAYANRDDLGGDYQDTSREGFALALDISAYSLIPISRHSARLMQASGGSIITLSFQASQRVFPGYNVMGTAKAALEHAMRQLASELGPINVRVNALSPGPLDTVSSRVIQGYATMKGMHKERAPLNRNVTHEEVAKAALFLCSDLSSGITGIIMPVDGGYNIMGI
jgi:enoyl-[acyl-carrier protein] reductase I